jgi:hypothetical protein
MHRRTIRLFAALSVVMVAALAFGLFASTTGQTHAAGTGRTGSPGVPRFVHFHSNFSDAALAATHLKHWSSSFKSGGITYTYSMVGTNPSKGSATTTVPVTIVPMILKFSNGTIFDGTQKVSGTTGSPLFQNASFISGNTQYGDAIQRGEFWKFVSTSSPNYHVLVGTPTIATAVTINVPSADGATAKDASTGNTIGLININWFDPKLQGLLTSLGYTPTMLPIFLANNVYLTQGAPRLANCCIGGYHNAVSNNAGLQTYIFSTNADEGIQGGFGDDVSALSHELAEWLNDPFTTNVVPNWISPIAPQYGCNNALEVGDPLVGVTFTVAGFSSSHLQDEAFFSWFARRTTSIGYNKQYTYLGTFTSLSQHC